MNSQDFYIPVNGNKKALVILNNHPVPAENHNHILSPNAEK